MKSRGMLIVFSGPAGTGKGTVCKEFLKRNPDSVLSVSATTRLPRPGETDGKEYFFVSREEFEETIKKDGFLEYACFCDNYYGTPKKAVDEKLENGFNVILEIEVQGAMQIKEKVPEAVFVFISPPSKKVLRERIEGRGTETPEVIKQGSRYGVRLKAVAPSIHMIRVDVESTFEPIIGSETQSKELIDSLMKNYDTDPSSVWKSEIFGRSLDVMVQEGIRGKLSIMPDNIRNKLQMALTKAVNKGSNNMIAIVL